MDTECSSLLDRLLQVNGSTIQAASRVFSDPILPPVGFYASTCSYAGKSPVLGPRIAGLAPLCQRGLRLGRCKVNQPERHQHDNLPKEWSASLTRGRHLWRTSRNTSKRIRHLRSACFKANMGTAKAQHMLWWARRSLAYFGYWKVDIVFTKIIKELAGSGLHRVLFQPADASTASTAVATAAHRVVSESVENQFRSPAMLYHLGLDYSGSQQSTRRSFLTWWRQSKSVKGLQRSKSRRHRMVNRVLHRLQLTANRID